MAYKTLGSLLAGWSNQRYFLATEQGEYQEAAGREERQQGAKQLY